MKAKIFLCLETTFSFPDTLLKFHLKYARFPFHNGHRTELLQSNPSYELKNLIKLTLIMLRRRRRMLNAVRMPPVASLKLFVFLLLLVVVLLTILSLYYILVDDA